MGSSDFALKEYTYDDIDPNSSDPDLTHFSVDHDKSYILPMLVRAKTINPAMTYLASPWSPPARMKTSKSVERGNLVQQYWPSFANYHLKFLQQYASLGVKIDYLTLQNEPFNTAGFPTMYMSPTDQRDIIKQQIGPLFAKNNIDTKILVMDHNWDMADYVLTILNDAQAKSYVAGSAWHCYAGDPSAQGRVQSAHPDKDIFFTECSGGTWAPNWSDNLVWMTSTLFIGSVKNWARGVVLWNLALDQKNGPFIPGGCATCRGVVTILPNGNYSRNEEYYALAHNSKFVDVGATRVQTTSTNEGVLQGVAYKNPSGSLVAVVVNTSGQSQTFDLTWNGQYVTMPNFPPKSVVTFVWGN